MRVVSVRLLALLFAVCLLSSVSVPPGISHAAVPRRAAISHLVLTLRDLPSGFKQTLGRVVTNRQADTIGNVAPGTSARSGRIIGYTAVFQRKVGAGLTEVRNAISLFRAAPEAHRKLVRAVRQAENGALPPGYHHLKVSSVGNESNAFIYALNAHTRGVAVYFRRGLYVTEIIGEGLGTSFRSGQVASLAHVVDRRIAQAGA